MASSTDNAAQGPDKICWQCGATYTPGLDYCPEDGAQLVELDPSETRDMLIGRVFDERFRVVGKLGEGGMSDVYAARRIDGDGEVALKILKADFLRDEEVRKRFMYEARTITSLEHDNAVDLYDFGQAPDGSFYMVMELLQGESLADRLERGYLSYRETFRFLGPMCGVLAEAHAKDVIHRDLKPENIFLADAGADAPIPKLLDFGIAKHLKFQTVTQSDALWGTPAYMSPEQASGDAVSGRADIYAMGVMLYELVAGVLPFRATTAMGFAVKHMHREAPRLSETPGLKSVPDPLEELIARMLAKEPDERPESMQVVSESLERMRDEVFNPRLLDMVPAQEVDRNRLEPPSDPEAGEQEAKPSVDAGGSSGGRRATARASESSRNSGNQSSQQTVIGDEVQTATPRQARETPTGWDVGSRRSAWWKRASTWVSLAAIGTAVGATVWIMEPWQDKAGGEASSKQPTVATSEEPADSRVDVHPQLASRAAGVAARVAVRARTVAGDVVESEDEEPDHVRTAPPARPGAAANSEPPQPDEGGGFVTPGEEGTAPTQGSKEGQKKGKDDKDLREALEGTF